MLREERARYRLDVSIAQHRLVVANEQYRLDVPKLRFERVRHRARLEKFSLSTVKYCLEACGLCIIFAPLQELLDRVRETSIFLRNESTRLDKVPNDHGILLNLEHTERLSLLVLTRG